MRPAWTSGLTGVPDGAGVFSNVNRVLIANNPAFDLMLGDLQSYRFEMDIRPTVWYDHKGVISYLHLDGGGFGTEGYLLTLEGTSTGLDSLGAPANKIQLSLWTDNGGTGNLWQASSDPAIKPLPHYDDGLWHHIAVEIHPNANPAQTYVKFEIDGDAAGTVYNTGGWIQSNITVPVAASVDNFTLADPQFLAINGFSGKMDNVKFSNITIPEPGTVMLLFTGLVGLLCYAWRKRK